MFAPSHISQSHMLNTHMWPVAPGLDGTMLSCVYLPISFEDKMPSLHPEEASQSLVGRMNDGRRNGWRDGQM